MTIRVRRGSAARRFFVLAAAVCMGIPIGVASAGYTAIDLYTTAPPAGSTYLSYVTGQAIGAYPGGSGGQLVGWGPRQSNTPHALLWDGTAIAIDLNPSGFMSSLAHATDGKTQVGYAASTAAGLDSHAMLWSGSAGSAVDLHPAAFGFTRSTANGVSGSQQVGAGVIVSDMTTISHALIWSGTAASAVDINPLQLGITSSSALATDGRHQVGSGSGTITNNNDHALLWTGTSLSALDLHPYDSVYIWSEALGTGGGEQVGYRGMQFGNSPHAMLWQGSVASAVDLNPAGYNDSVAFGTDGTRQVGMAIPAGGQEHAVMWNGTPSSIVDLGAQLPAGFSVSAAFTINAAGNVFGDAIDSSGIVHAIEWAQHLLPGDANFDGRVNFADLLITAQHYGATGQNFGTGDFNGDGSVNFADLLILAQNYGASASAQSFPANAVPEPTQALTMTVTSTLFVRRRRLTG